MSTPAPRTRSRSSRLLAVVTTLLVAASGLFVVPTAANAAGPELSITLAPRAGGEVTVTGSGFLYENSPSAPGIYIGFGPSGLPGFYGYSDQMDQIDNLTGLNGGINSDGTFTLTFTVPAYTEGASYSVYTSKGHGQGSFDPSQNAIGVVPWEALPATATTTTLAADQTSVELGTAVTLTATVDPAAPGTVEFFNNSASLGSPVATSGSTAVLSGVVLPVGANSIAATFTPADPAAYLGSSTAAPTVVTVTAPAGAVGTATTVNAPTPAAPVELGAEVVLSAAVAATDDTPNTVSGSVEFFSIADGTTDRVSLGSSPVESGLATLATSSLTAGGHSFAAVFTPANAAHFLSSEGVRTANFGVVDTSAPTPYVPGSSAVITTGATATWDWSVYSAGWAKTASGNATVNGQTFELSDGEVLADAGGAVISFEATLINTAYGTVVMSITDPALHLRADGSGVWVASVNGGTDRIVVGTFSGVDAQPGEDATRTVDFDYADTTDSGTWSAGRTGAWPNAFILEMPSSVRAFYYQSGAGADGNKPASPLSVEFEWPAVSATSLTISPAAPVVLGSDVTLTATVAPPNAEGTVEFFDLSAVDGETSLGTVSVNGGIATLTTDELVAGGHTFRVEYSSTNGFDDSTATITANYGVVDTAQAAVCTPASGASETLSGVTAEWDWNAYSSGWQKFAGGNATVSGQTFTLSNGTATVSDDCVSIAFTGTLRTEAYQSFFPTHGQWVELVNPVLTIDSSGNGAWTAGVRTGAGDLNTATSAPTVIAAVQGATFPDFSQNAVTAQVDLAYAGTTAVGTWSAGRDSAWSNAFVLQVPSSIRSFYYASGAGADGNKPPAAIHLDWALAAPSGSVNGQTADPRVLQGQTVTFEAGPFREGDVVSIVVNSDPVVLPSVTVGFDGLATQSWTVPADFELGAHSVTFSTGSGASARSVVLPFTVEPAGSSIGGGSTPDVCIARAVTGGSMSWEFKQSFKNYIQGPIAHGTFSGGYFTASGGAVNVNAGGIGTVNFQGSIVATGHGGTLDLQIQNPTVQITGPNSGVLYGTLTQSGSGGYVAIANLGFSSVSASAGGLTATGSAATLTGAASAAFGGFYSAGTELDPVSFSASLGGEVPCDATTDPVELAKGGADADLSLVLLSIGALVMLAGFGLTRIRRRATA